MKSGQYKNMRVRLKGREEIIIKNEIAQGSFSNVYLTSDSQCIAKIANFSYPPAKEAFNNEWMFFERLCPHTRIINFWGAQEITENNIGILLLENCPKGTLIDLMKLSPKQQLSEQQILRIILQVSQGLDHIHAKGLVHRDIKLENILYSQDENFKICDFGSMTANKLQNIGDSQVQQLIEEIKINTTPMYRSPEQIEPSLFRDSPLGEKVDIFALGVIAYLLCFKKPPFESALGAVTGTFKWPELPATSDEFKSLISQMLSVDPSQRPSSQQIIQTITEEIKFDEDQDGLIDPFIFQKDGLKEAKASWAQKFQNKITGIFFHTSGWIKGALQIDEYGPKQEFIIKLLQKAWKTPEKIDKFYLVLGNNWKDKKSNSIMNLKMLVLLHNYFKKGPIQTIAKLNRKTSADSILDNTTSHWEDIQKHHDPLPKDIKRTQFSIKLIINYSKLLKEKLILHQKYTKFFEGNFSPNPFLQNSRKNYKPLEPELLFDLLTFLNSLVTFAYQNLLQQGQIWNLQACISLSIVDEMYCLICLIFHLYKTFKLSTNYNTNHIDKNLFQTFVLEQDISLEQTYKKVIQFFNRCSYITETAIPVQSLIPQLPLAAMDFIKGLQICSHTLTQFNIFEHLNYTQNIYGLRLPQSLEPETIQALSKTAPIPSSTTLFNSLPSLLKNNDNYLNYNQDQNGKNDLKSKEKDDKLKKNKKDKCPIQQKKQEEITDNMLDQDQQSVNLMDFQVSDEEERDYTKKIDNKAQKSSKKYNDKSKSVANSPFDLWKEGGGQNDEVNNLFSQFQSTQEDQMQKVLQAENHIETFQFLPSHPQLINPNQQTQLTYQLPTHPQNQPFNVQGLNQSLHQSLQKIREQQNQQQFLDLDDIFEISNNELENIEINKNAQTENNFKQINTNIKQNFIPFDSPQKITMQQINEINSIHNKDNKSNKTAPNNKQNENYPLPINQQQMKPQNQFFNQPILSQSTQSQKMNYQNQLRQSQQPQNIFQFPPQQQQQQQQQQFVGKQLQDQQSQQKIPSQLNNTSYQKSMDNHSPSIQESQYPIIMQKQEVPKNQGQANSFKRQQSSEVQDDEEEPKCHQTVSNSIKLVTEPGEQMRKTMLQINSTEQNNSNTQKKDKLGLFEDENSDDNDNKDNGEEEGQHHKQLIKYIKNEVSDEFYNFIIDISEIKMGVKIGSGCSCEVFKGDCKNKIVAIKIIKLENSEEIHLKEFQREIAALIKLKNHKNLLQLVAISSLQHNFYIITEFCEGGTLFDLLHKQRKKIKIIPWKHRLSWLLGIAKGMAYLHKNNLIHRDLKSLNLLFDKIYDPQQEVAPCIKIADFGLTKVGTNTLNPHASGVLGTFVINLYPLHFFLFIVMKHWMAPETMRNNPSNFKADVYSFAIVMWELCVRQTPFKNLDGVVQVIKFVADDGGRPDLTLLPLDIPKGLKELMINCWEEDPNKRPQFNQIVEILQNPEVIQCSN